MKNTKTAPQTIDRKTLAACTGLTERRLRQMVAEGIIPAPENGAFPLVETVSRLLGYYQSMNNELRDKKLKEEIRKLQIVNDTRAGKLQDANALGSWLGALMSNALLTLEQKLLNELPALVEGLDAPQIRAKARKIYDQFRVDLQPMARKAAESLEK